MTAQIRFPQGLYGITPEWDDTSRLIAAIELAATHGMRSLQLRRKNISAAARREQAERLQAACRTLGVVFIINDDWQLARDIGADGVHIGREDANLTAVRAAVGPDMIVGTSCYNDFDLAQTALAQGADYVAYGAMYPSPTKPQAARAGLDLLARTRALLETYESPRPALVAIGGITPANAAAVADAGADALAVITGLFETDDIAAAAQAVAGAIARAHPNTI